MGNGVKNSTSESSNSNAGVRASNNTVFVNQDSFKEWEISHNTIRRK